MFKLMGASAEHVPCVREHALCVPDEYRLLDSRLRRLFFANEQQDGLLQMTGLSIGPVWILHLHSFTINYQVRKARSKPTCALLVQTCRDAHTRCTLNGFRYRGKVTNDCPCSLRESHNEARTIYCRLGSARADVLLAV